MALPSIEPSSRVISAPTFAVDKNISANGTSNPRSRAKSSSLSSIELSFGGDGGVDNATAEQFRQEYRAKNGSADEVELPPEFFEGMGAAIKTRLTTDAKWHFLEPGPRLETGASPSELIVSVSFENRVFTNDIPPVTPPDIPEPPDPPDPPPETTYLSIAALDTENPGGSDNLFHVTRTGPVSGVSSTDWAVTGSGQFPADAADFDGGVLPSGTLVFAVDEKQKNITITTTTDGVQGFGDGYTVTLSNPTGATIATASASGVILA
jgi:hypothetical protein